MEYGYGHTAEAAKLVRTELNTRLKPVVKELGLKISVRTPGRGHHYGGPRVKITTTRIELDKRYAYIENSDGSGIGDGPGKLVERPCSEFTQGRPHHTARLVEPKPLTDLNKFINKVLSKYGVDKDDAMTDYFQNTTPLFYGVEYEK